MGEPTALFVPDGDAFVPTERARGPWDPGALHGGPVAALLARALERDGFLLSRLTVELLRPVPLAPLVLTTAEERPGRNVQLASASVAAAGTEVARAVGLRVRLLDEPLDLPAAATAPPATVSPPESGTPLEDQWNWEAFHNAGVDMRFVDGSFERTGPSTVWIRLRQHVVAGEEPTGVQRAMAAADFSNGVSVVVPFEGWLFINPDLTVNLLRRPQGEWICVDAATTVSSHGTGVAASALHDAAGPVGRASQSLLVDRR